MFLIAACVHIDCGKHLKHLKYTVSVRALCEFTAKHGDLDLRFTPSPSAQEGIAGHGIVTSRRGTDYLPEVSLQGDYKLLQVRGRADGYDPVNNQLEEIKTFRGDLHAMPENRRNLHWAQAKIYGWLLCCERQLESINLALVYFDVATLDETPLVESYTRADLKAYFESLCELFLAWAEGELAHRTARDAALRSLAFVHPAFRPGQRELAEAVYKTASSGKCLMAQATTGIGKTIGTVFPLLKAMPGQRLDKLFYLAAKTPGRKLALTLLIWCAAAMAVLQKHHRHFAFWNLWQETRPASTWTRPATAIRAHLPRAFMTGCPMPATQRGSTPAPTR
jgi:DNA excision repair protein ERCC-2